LVRHSDILCASCPAMQKPRTTRLSGPAFFSGGRSAGGGR
jgi:hypothetical protein